MANLTILLMNIVIEKSSVLDTVFAWRLLDCESICRHVHNLRLCMEHYDVNCRLNLFVCRNINVWSQLPVRVVNSNSAAIFKHLAYAAVSKKVN